MIKVNLAIASCISVTYALLILRLNASSYRWREHGASSWHSETIYPIKKNSFEWMGKHAIQGNTMVQKLHYSKY